MTRSYLPASLLRHIQNYSARGTARYLLIGVTALSVLAITVIGVHIHQYKDRPITLLWEPYAPVTDLSGYLYAHTYNRKTFFLSTEEEFTSSLLTISEGTLTLEKVSPFFNPNACAKMPSASWNGYLLFRDFGEKNEAGFSDILYAYNTETKSIQELHPPFKIIGDIYTYRNRLYFFFTIHGNDLFEAWTEDSLDIFTASFITSDFETGKMQFYGGEPVFTYNQGSLLKYVYNPGDRTFKLNNSYTKPGRLTSNESSLVFLFPNTEYIFTDTKGFKNTVQNLSLGSLELFEHRGALNVFPIGSKAE